MSSANAIANDKSNAPRRERRNRRSLLDHLVDTVVNNFSKPEMERELSPPLLHLPVLPKILLL